MHYTGEEHDPETSLENLDARYDSSSMGRFISPDPSGVFLADLRDPQQLNLYSYVRNNPLSLVDPSGLDCVYLNDDGTAVASIDSNSNAQECTGLNANGEPNGGYWFNGTVDPSSIQTDQNSDWVFANGTAGNNQFSCTGAECDQDSLNSFVNSVVGSNPAMVYAQGSSTGTIQSGLPFNQTVTWYENNGFNQHWIEGSHDPWHPGQLNLRDNQPVCSTHVLLNPSSGQGGQPTTGDFHADAVNPWANPGGGPSVPGVTPSTLSQPLGHLLADIIPDQVNFKTSAHVCH